MSVNSLAFPGLPVFKGLAVFHSGDINFKGLETKLEPVRAGDDRAGKDDKQNPQDHAAAATGARTAAPKTESVLQPVEQPRQHNQFQKSAQAT